MFKNQSLHFPHNMRGNATIPTKAHWIEPEFAFTLRTANVDVGRLCALVGVKVKPKSAYSEYRWHPFKVLPLGHAGKFCSGQGGDVTTIPVRQRPLPRPASPCHLSPTSLFTSPFCENLISSVKTGNRNRPTRGADTSFARDRTKPQDDASRSAACVFGRGRIFRCDLLRGPASNNCVGLCVGLCVAF